MTIEHLLKLENAFAKAERQYIEAREHYEELRRVLRNAEREYMREVLQGEKANENK